MNLHLNAPDSLNQYLKTTTHLQQKILKNVLFEPDIDQELNY